MRWETYRTLLIYISSFYTSEQWKLVESQLINQEMVKTAELAKECLKGNKAETYLGKIVRTAAIAGSAVGMGITALPNELSSKETESPDQLNISNLYEKTPNVAVFGGSSSDEDDGDDKPNIKAFTSRTVQDEDPDNERTPLKSKSSESFDMEGDFEMPEISSNKGEDMQTHNHFDRIKGIGDRIVATTKGKSPELFDMEAYLEIPKVNSDKGEDVQTHNHFDRIRRIRDRIVAHNYFNRVRGIWNRILPTKKRKLQLLAVVIGSGLIIGTIVTVVVLVRKSMEKDGMMDETVTKHETVTEHETVTTNVIMIQTDDICQPYDKNAVLCDGIGNELECSILHRNIHRCAELGQRKEYVTRPKDCWRKDNNPNFRYHFFSLFKEELNEGMKSVKSITQLNCNATFAGFENKILEIASLNNCNFSSDLQKKLLDKSLSVCNELQHGTNKISSICIAHTYLHQAYNDDSILPVDFIGVLDKDLQLKIYNCLKQNYPTYNGEYSPDSAMDQN